MPTAMKGSSKAEYLSYLPRCWEANTIGISKPRMQIRSAPEPSLSAFHRPQEKLGGRQISWPRGKVLGGSRYILQIALFPVPKLHVAQ